MGDLFDLDGGFWEVKSADGDAVMYSKTGDDVEEDCGRSVRQMILVA
jgi:hypothetical protein